MRWSLEAWILKVSVAHGGALTVASGGLGVGNGVGPGSSTCWTSASAAAGASSAATPAVSSARLMHRVCGITGSVAESGSSCTGA